MSLTAIDTNNDASSHAYAGLEKPDANPATWIDYQSVEESANFDSLSDWHKTKKQTYYHHLDDMNRGYVNGNRRNKPFYTFQSNLHISQALASTLELTGSQKSTAEKWFRRLDFEKLGHSLEVVGLAICAHIVHESERDLRECHSNSPKSKWPPEFRGLYDHLSERDKARYKKVYGQVAYRIQQWSIGDTPGSEKMDKFGMCGSHLAG